MAGGEEVIGRLSGTSFSEKGARRRRSSRISYINILDLNKTTDATMTTDLTS